MKEALLYQKLDEKKVRCNLCAHRCVIHPGKSGICKVRDNIDGKLFTKVYGRAIAQKNLCIIFIPVRRLIHLPHPDVIFTVGSVRIGKYPRFPMKGFWKWDKR